MFPSFLSFAERYPRYIALVGFFIFVMGVTLYGFQQISLRTAEAPVVESTENVVEIQESFPVPTRTDFDPITPDDFMTGIPLEGKVAFEQAYSLEYPEQKQYSVVFSSMMTIKENYVMYEDFLKNQGWNILNVYESDIVSSLYATKESEEVNITISEANVEAGKSQVSISVLKK